MRQENKDKKFFNTDPFKVVMIHTPAGTEKCEVVRPPVNVMIDIETLGQGPDACMAEIGACAVVDGVRQDLEIRVRLTDAVESGGRIDPETVQWWLRRDDAARREMADDRDRVSVIHALVTLGEWIGGVRDLNSNVNVWSCGTDFDLVILAGYYRRCHINLPWAFWEARDYRTMKAIFPEVLKPNSETAHTALRDATDQMDHLVMILAHIESLRAERVKETAHA